MQFWIIYANRYEMLQLRTNYANRYEMPHRIQLVQLGTNGQTAMKCHIGLVNKKIAKQMVSVTITAGKSILSIKGEHQLGWTLL